MKILITGLCSLHWGRLEYGNVGNFYIIETLFKELNRVSPDDEIVTTFQFTNEFIEKYNIRENIPKENLNFLEGVYSPAIIKGVIGKMNMMITGIVHASVAEISQNIPTFFIPHSKEIKSTKILGFASLAGVENYVAFEKEDIKNKIELCFDNLEDVKAIFEEKIPLVKKMLIKYLII